MDADGGSMARVMGAGRRWGGTGGSDWDGQGGGGGNKGIGVVLGWVN